MDRIRSVAKLFLLRGVLSARLGPASTILGGVLTASAITAAALALRLWLSPWLTGAQFITFVPAIVLSTALWGSASGLIAVALTAWASTLLPGSGPTALQGVSITLFGLVGCLEVGIISALLASNTALKASLERVGELNAQLRLTEARFRGLIETAPDAIVIVDRREQIALANGEAERMFGYGPGELIGRPIDILMPKRFRAQHHGRIGDFLLKPGIRRMGDGNELFGVRSDGAEFPIETNLSALPEGLVCSVIRDLTVRREHQERQSLLIRELNHRVKNTLASVQSIAAQTLRAAANPKAFADALTARILALSQSHDVLTRNDWQGARIGEIVAEQLRPYERSEGAPFRLLGPGVQLSPNRAVTLGMVIGELSTNAAKFGALSADGVVDVIWEVRPGPAGDLVLRLTWTERGGPPVTPPTRSGFGARLIERSLAAGLHGSAQLRFESEGLTCELSFPLLEREATSAS